MRGIGNTPLLPEPSTRRSCDSSSPSSASQASTAPRPKSKASPFWPSAGALFGPNWAAAIWPKSRRNFEDTTALIAAGSHYSRRMYRDSRQLWRRAPLFSFWQPALFLWQAFDMLRAVAHLTHTWRLREGHTRGDRASYLTARFFSFSYFPVRRRPGAVPNVSLNSRARGRFFMRRPCAARNGVNYPTHIFCVVARREVLDTEAYFVGGLHG